MELNINSPAYFTQQYGVDEDVYRYCQRCYEYFKDKEYSESLTTVGICPQAVPKDLYQQGKWKEQVRFIGKAGCASIHVRIDFDQYYNADSAEKVAIIKDAILKAMKKIKMKGRFDYETFSQDLQNMPET